MIQTNKVSRITKLIKTTDTFLYQMMLKSAWNDILSTDKKFLISDEIIVKKDT